MGMEHAAKPGPSKNRERVANLGIGSGTGQPHRGQVGRGGWSTQLSRGPAKIENELQI